MANAVNAVADNGPFAGAGERNALVVGGSGLLGSNLIRALGDQPAWRVTTLSRRPVDTAVPVRHIGVDLLDRAQLSGAAASFADITHVFFCSRAVGRGYAISVDANAAMLENLMDVVVTAAPQLAHVQLVHGLKWYGSHVGAFKLPAKESDPAHVDSSFYKRQHDALIAHRAGRAWTWSTIRPHFICAVAADSPSNLGGVLGVFAAILRELGETLWFPGTEQSFDAITSVSDIDLLTKLMVWAATEPGCANNAFNAANGDCFRWRDIWPRIARTFGLKPADPRPTNLPLFMQDKGRVWEAIVRKHGLRPRPFEQIADWHFAHNNAFGLTWDVFASTIKAHRFGFHEMVDSEEMFDRLFARYRELRLLPY
jgi:nucleoside-diphosphate-sugar epimerase